MDPTLTASLTSFAIRFGNELKKEQGNEGRSLVCSPLSAQAVLALTALGSHGGTREQLLRAMSVPDNDAIRSLFSYVTNTMKSQAEGITLKMANKVYVTTQGTLKPDILKDAVDVFDAGLEQVDFNDGADVAGRVNKWVAEQTDDMIKNVMDKDTLKSDTRLLLINAIYFQGFWEKPFEETSTKDRSFYVNAATKIEVPMMYRENVSFSYKHSPELKAKLLKMNYKGREASLVVVLPDDVEGLDGVLQQFAAGHDLVGELGRMSSTLLDVQIPKFKIETDIDLKEFLPKMGIESIFDKGKSDIRMLTSNQRLYVSPAFQRALIEVNEMGTKAAACTFFGKRPVKRPKKHQFKADHPFLYLLKVREIPAFFGIYQGSEFATSS